MASIPINGCRKRRIAVLASSYNPRSPKDHQGPWLGAQQSG
jgi:hypothetical protein